MATKLYFRNTAVVPDYGTGNNDANIRGTPTGWASFALSLTAGTAVVVLTGPTVAGPTAGVEVEQAIGQVAVFYSPPLDADVTISGSITWNLWASEVNMTDNVAINGRLEVIDGATGAITLIDQTARVTEVAVTTRTLNNFSETPAAGVACKRGDRLRVRIFGDDLGATAMGAGGNFSLGYSGTAANLVDSWFQLTENLTFVSEPAGTTIYPTDTASDVSTASVDREAWTSRGGGVAIDAVSGVAGWTAPLQMTDSAGGTVVDWFTRQLTAFTLGGAVRVNARVRETSTSVNGAIRCEVARVESDGTSPTVWAAGTFPTEPTASEAAQSFLIAGDDLAISDGQRLRIRFYADDSGVAAMAAAGDVWLYYAGTSGGASGDTYLTFTQTLTEYSAGPQTLTIPLLDGAPALYAPSLTFPTQAMTLGLLDASKALYAPSVGFTLAVPLLDGAPALYAPTVTPKWAMTVPLLDGAPALYAPALVATNTLTVPLLDGAPTLYAPSVIPDQFVTLDLLDASNALYAPTVVDVKYVGLPLLDGAPALSAPALQATNLITLALLDAGNALYGPTVVGAAQVLTVPLLDASPSVYAPALVAKNTFTLALLDGAPALYAPTVVPGAITFSLGLLDAAPALYAPTVYQDVFVTVPLLDAGNALYAPTLAAAAISATLPLLDAGNAVYAPSLLPQAVSVVLGLLDASGAVYAPSLATRNTLTVPLLDAGPALYAPTVIQDQFLTLPLLDGAPAVYAPSLARYNALAVPLLDAANATYAPTLAQDQFLTVPLLDSGPTLSAPLVLQQGGPQAVDVAFLDASRALYAPAVVPAPVAVSLPLLDSSRAVFSPTVAVGPVWVTLPMLDAAPDVYAPLVEALAPDQALDLAFLEAQNALYAPAILAGAVTLGLDLLDAGADLFAPALAGGFVAFLPPHSSAGVTTGGMVASVGAPVMGATVRVRAPAATVGTDGHGVTVVRKPGLEAEVE